jgi:hypothetical protein
MDTTASSFTLRKNAKRAAEAMIRKGIGARHASGEQALLRKGVELTNLVCMATPRTWTQS